MSIVYYVVDARIIVSAHSRGAARAKVRKLMRGMVMKCNASESTLQDLEEAYASGVTGIWEKLKEEREWAKLTE